MENSKSHYVSDLELEVLAKYLKNQTEIAKVAGITQQRISQRLKKLTMTKKRKSISNAKEKVESVKVDPKKISTERLLEIIYSSLLTEKDKEDIPSNIKLSINRELLHLTEIQSRVRQEILESEAMDIILDEINLILGELDPIKQQRFWGFIRTNSKLAWLVGKEVEPETLIEETEKKKVKDSWLSETPAIFDKDAV